MRRSNFFIGVLLLLVAISLIRAQRFTIQSQFQSFYGQKIGLRGIIVNDPEEKNGRENLEILPDAFKQKVLLTVFSGQDFKYGDYLLVQGKLTIPKEFGGFDYPDYLAAKNIYGEMFLPKVFVLNTRQGNKVFYYSLVFKKYLFNKILKLLPEPQAGLMIALISGDKNYLSDSVAAQFNNTGGAHIIAVSGYKLTLIFISLESLIKYLGRRRIFILSAAFAIFYLIAADFAPAVLRAVVMSVLFLIARQTGRKYRILPALLLTAVILLLVNPLIIKYDIGFILSFTGILGILYFGPLLRPVFKKLPNKFGLKEIAVSSVSAQLATAPIIAYYFQQFTPLAPLTNVLTVPLMAPLILSGYLFAVPVLNRLTAYFSGFGLKFMLFVVRFFAHFGFAALSVHISKLGLGLLYAAEIGTYIFINKLLKKPEAFDKLRK